MLKRNKAKQDESGKYLPNGQSAKTGLTTLILDNGWGKFVDILTHQAANAGVSVVKVSPNNTSQIYSCCDGYAIADIQKKHQESGAGHLPHDKTPKRW